MVARGLQGCDGRLGRVEPAVSDGQGGVEGRLLHVSKQGGGELLVHVRRRGAKCHGRGEARGVGVRQQRRGDLLVHVRPGLLRGQVDGQLVLGAFEAVGGGLLASVALFALAMAEFMAAVVL